MSSPMSPLFFIVIPAPFCLQCHPRPLLFAVSSPRRRGSRKAYCLSGFLLEFIPAKAGAGMTIGITQMNNTLRVTCPVSKYGAGELPRLSTGQAPGRATNYLPAAGKRATSYELRVTKYELRTTSYELRTTSYELRTTSYELRTTSYELRATNYELRVTSYELRITSHELRATSYELRATSYELRT